MRERLDGGGRVVVVGGGWIGSEFAASARQRGLEVTMIDPVALPNERIFGAEVGAFYRDVHAQHGIELAARRGRRVVRGRWRRRDRSRHRATGRVVECDFAVVGIGVAPRVELAREAGLEVDDGILVDQHLQTSAPNVFAAGDVANAWHPFFEERVRVEHWANALNQGPAAARAMLGEPTTYGAPLLLLRPVRRRHGVLRLRARWDKVVFRGDRDSGEFVAFWLRDQRVVAGMNVNVWDVNEHVQALIRSPPGDRPRRAERSRYAP